MSASAFLPSRPSFPRRLFRAISRVAIACVVGLIYLTVAHSYHQTPSDVLDTDADGISNLADDDIDGDSISNAIDTDIDGDGISNVDDIIQSARTLKWTAYDYLQGRYNNIGYKAGFRVCIDVPKVGYDGAGIYLERILRDDYSGNPAHFNNENGINTPVTPFFFRRARNLLDYCKANGFYVESCTKPRVGDLVFYGRLHIAMISAVHPDGTVDEIETAPWTLFCLEHREKVWQPMAIGRLLTDSGTLRPSINRSGS